MLGRLVLQRTFVSVLVTALVATGLDAAGAAAQPASAPAATAQTSATSATAPASDDMAMPADMGASISEPAPSPAPKADRAAKPGGPVQRLSVNTPIAVIASTPQGKAALEHELPGLCERPEYVMFRNMSPAKLALLSNGRISQAKLIHLQAHLVKVSVATSAEPPRRNLLAEGATRVKRFSQSAYHRVVSAIEAL